MAQINENYYKLKAGYLFPEIGRRVKQFAEANPQARIIRLGIGDVTEPLAPAVIAAMKTAVEELAHRETFRGYGPDQGYDFLTSAIAQHDYKARGIDIATDEVFVSDGSKCDTGNILDIFGRNNKVAVQDPVYPVYVDTNVMDGRTGEATAEGRYQGLTYLPCTAENGFAPDLPKERVDLIYLCYPNNPTGAVATKEALTRWVNYAREHKSVILFDSAYEAFISEVDIPHSIYEIEGAREVAIEFRSFSKTAGFTGVRCAYTIVPRELMGATSGGEQKPIHALWARRHATKFNGVSYPVQCGAAAVYSPEGQKQIRETIDFYMENARLLREGLKAGGIEVHGGVNAPYIWLKTPDGLSSWDFFDRLLSRAHVVGTPGSGFGACGEGYFRLSAFNSRANIEEALKRFPKALG